MKYLQAYQKMLLIRRFEERVAELHRAGQVPGFTHLYWGQEAIAVGVCHWLRDDDYVLSTHRGHGHCLAKGADPGRVLAEIMGRSTGYCRGKGGSMHVAAFNRGVLGANGIVAASLPIATGVALASRLEGNGQVAVAFFGDAAVEEGPFHESLNLASLWDLPLVFVCENNQYAISVPVQKRQAGKGAAAIAEAHGLKARKVDGNDVVAMLEASQWAVEQARACNPILLECATIRWGGHHSAQPTRRYRSQEELEATRAACPIARLGKRLIAEKEATPEEIEEINTAIMTRIDEAARFAQQSPFPKPDEAMQDVYAMQEGSG